MAYFNNAFNKTFIADSTLLTAGTATSNLTGGQLALIDGSTWDSVALPGGAGVPAISPASLGYLAQGSFYTNDNIGNNPGHGGYKESVKSKGINPKYITRLWKANCLTAMQATASLTLGPECTPCGTTQFIRLDVKGSPALRFLNHNSYAIGDSGNLCCHDTEEFDQEYLDPTLVLATAGSMVLSNPLITPFVDCGSVNGVLTGGEPLVAGSGYAPADDVATECVDCTGSGATIDILTVGTGGDILTYSISAIGSGYEVGDVLTIAGGNADATLTVTAVTEGCITVTITDEDGIVSQTVYTIEQALGNAVSGNYVPTTRPNLASAMVSATIYFVGAYVDTQFGDCSFDTRDHFNKEPIVIIPTLLDETGDPCNDCGVATSTPGQMQQTQGEEVMRELILSERYRQSPFNQGNSDSSRIREIEMSDKILSAVDRTATYKAYYIQHTVPRFNNPTGVFDNDQYLYKIYVKCSDTEKVADMDKLMVGLVAWAGDNGNKLVVETGTYW